MSNHSFADDIHDEHMGLMTSYRWAHDPKTVLFQLARYQFIARILQGYGDVLEVGCGDGFGSRLVRASVGRLTCIDIDKQMIESAQDIHDEDVDITFVNCGMKGIQGRAYDAVYALDVLEHVQPYHDFEFDESAFMKDFAGLAPVGIIGMPSLESQAYASPLSKQNHVNCKTEDGLRETMRRHYKHVFIFGMNDSVLHTAFGPMTHYRLALGIN